MDLRKIQMQNLGREEEGSKEQDMEIYLGAARCVTASSQITF
jgi:hypothetical protein